MGLKTFSVFIVVFSIALFYLYQQIAAPLPAPKLDVNKNWGPTKKADKIPAGIISQKIQYPSSVIEDLQKRLAEPLHLREPLEGVGFRYGFHKSKLESIIAYWRDNYLPRWNERQVYLNSLPHFSTEIQGLNIHFIHSKPKSAGKDTKTVPLLLLHGWPGSVREFYEIIPKLTTPSTADNIAFEVIAPSLPGYGWSDGASVPGLGPAEIAVVFRNLMIKLGHSRFLVQGGDWGSIIGTNIATLFPENVIAYHSNLCALLTPYAALKATVASFYPTLFIDAEYVDFVYPQGEKFKTIIEEMGYFHIQATKPDTIGAALSHNPVGLAAYILEKFSTWTNMQYRSLNDGGLDKHYTKDALLDNIMIYYLTNSITTSVRLYAEGFSQQQRDRELERVPVSANVPVGCARFKHDLMHSLDWQLRDKFPNLIHSTYHMDGGHFIAMQMPDVLYKDFVDFVRKLKLNK